MRLSEDIDENIQTLTQLLPIGRSFDLITRDLYLGNSRCFFLGINGFCDTGILQRIVSDLQSPEFTESEQIQDIVRYLNCRIGYAQASLAEDWDTILEEALSGPSVLFVDGFAQAILIDVRTYPSRSMEEPDTEHITKGARDGFVETLLLNTVLVRRRIRSRHLAFYMHKVGTCSRTDVSVVCLEDQVNPQLLASIREKIDSLNVTTLTMGSKSLEELLLPRKWYHPLPSILLTERPDVACSYLAEGHILIIVDNSPAVLVLPCTIFQFTQSPEDYYKSPVVGTYFRLIRFLCIPVSLLLMPLFLLLTAYFPEQSAQWQLLTSAEPSPARLTFYVLTVEFFLDLFQYAGALSSGKFSGALSIVGGLLIGDIAVSLNWASIEVLFYGAVTLLCSLSIFHICFSEALRIYRIFLILSTGFFGVYGFVISLIMTLVSIITTPTYGGFSYFWPLFPFNGKALYSLLFRSPTFKAQPSRVWRRGSVRR